MGLRLRKETSIDFTNVDLHWVAFLAGVLLAASASLASRWSRRLPAIVPKVAAAPVGPTTEGVVTRPEDSRIAEPAAAVVQAGKEHALYSSTMAGELTTWDDVARRLKDALEGDQFSLHAQRIEPASADARAPVFLEILLRLQEEEDNMVPPGAFLPLAEEHGLLPDIDRWVVRRLYEWAAGVPRVAQALFSVNISPASMADPRFIQFVRDCRRSRGGRGPGLCFEFNEAEAMADIDRTTEFVGQLANEGCRFALSAFGRDPVSFTLQRRIAFDYVKIDAGIIVAVERGPVALAKVKAINQVAHSLGAKTIAQCVESEAARSLLAAAGVDFVQGFAVSRPAPLATFFEKPALAAE